MDPQLKRNVIKSYIKKTISSTIEDKNDNKDLEAEILTKEEKQSQFTNKNVTKLPRSIFDIIPQSKYIILEKKAGTQKNMEITKENGNIYESINTQEVTEDSSYDTLKGSDNKMDKVENEERSYEIEDDKESEKGESVSENKEEMKNSKCNTKAKEASPAFSVLSDSKSVDIIDDNQFTINSSNEISNIEEKKSNLQNGSSEILPIGISNQEQIKCLSREKSENSQFIIEEDGDNEKKKIRIIEENQDNPEEMINLKENVKLLQAFYKMATKIKTQYLLTEKHYYKVPAEIRKYYDNSLIQLDLGYYMVIPFLSRPSLFFLRIGLTKSEIERIFHKKFHSIIKSVALDHQGRCEPELEVNDDLSTPLKTDVTQQSSQNSTSSGRMKSFANAKKSYSISFNQIALQRIYDLCSNKKENLKNNAKNTAEKTQQSNDNKKEEEKKKELDLIKKGDQNYVDIFWKNDRNKLWLLSSKQSKPVFSECARYSIYTLYTLRRLIDLSVKKSYKFALTKKKDSSDLYISYTLPIIDSLEFVDCSENGDKKIARFSLSKEDFDFIDSIRNANANVKTIIEILSSSVAGYNWGSNDLYYWNEQINYKPKPGTTFLGGITNNRIFTRVFSSRDIEGVVNKTILKNYKSIEELDNFIIDRTQNLANNIVEYFYPQISSSSIASSVIGLSSPQQNIIDYQNITSVYDFNALIPTENEAEFSPIINSISMTEDKPSANNVAENMGLINNEEFKTIKQKSLTQAQVTVISSKLPPMNEGHLTRLKAYTMMDDGLMNFYISFFTKIALLEYGFVCPVLSSHYFSDHCSNSAKKSFIKRFYLAYADMVVIPICKNAHWGGLIALKESKQSNEAVCFWVDSLNDGIPNKNFMLEFMDILIKNEFCLNCNVIYVQVPQQRNCYDCGYYFLLMVYFLIFERFEEINGKDAEDYRLSLIDKNICYRVNAYNEIMKEVQRIKLKKIIDNNIKKKIDVYVDLVNLQWFSDQSVQALKTWLLFHFVTNSELSIDVNCSTNTFIKEAASEKIMSYKAVTTNVNLEDSDSIQEISEQDCYPKINNNKMNEKKEIQNTPNVKENEDGKKQKETADFPTLNQKTPDLNDMVIGSPGFYWEINQEKEKKTPTITPTRTYNPLLETHCFNGSLKNNQCNNPLFQEKLNESIDIIKQKSSNKQKNILTPNKCNDKHLSPTLLKTMLGISPERQINNSNNNKIIN